MYRPLCQLQKATQGTGRILRDTVPGDGSARPDSQGYQYPGRQVAAGAQGRGGDVRDVATPRRIVRRSEDGTLDRFRQGAAVCPDFHDHVARAASPGGDPGLQSVDREGASVAQCAVAQDPGRSGQLDCPGQTPDPGDQNLLDRVLYLSYRDNPGAAVSGRPHRTVGALAGDQPAADRLRAGRFPDIVHDRMYHRPVRFSHTLTAASGDEHAIRLCPPAAGLLAVRKRLSGVTPDLQSVAVGRDDAYAPAQRRVAVCGYSIHQAGPYRTLLLRPHLRSALATSAGRRRPGGGSTLWRGGTRLMYALLVDVTKCTACEQCVAACVREHGLDRWQAEHDRATTRDGLSSHRLVSIQDVDDGRFARKSCMHCLEPSCVSACLVGGLTKSADGPVLYDRDKCIGCRYCMLACPFQVPRYEWDKTQPFMVKCDFCPDRLARSEPPACVAACPQGALSFGTREKMLGEARARIARSPRRYVDHIWGEKEFGGTSVLYIADVDLASLGWPSPEPPPIPSLTEDLVHKTPFIGFGVGLGLIALNWIVKRRNLLNSERQKLAEQDREEIWRPGDEEYD
ncbi:4Fe-4S dicluster domain-containing protein [candidate division GN15 bacterium]|nr:4Fe-4S dicluster domain-containing protein [candidate division GN15 bacterium]